MTSPISLLSMLTGATAADPAAPAQPQGEDAALFAAALVSALQQLQPPPRLVAVATPVVTETEVPEGEVAEGETPVEGEQPAATLGQLLSGAKVEAAETLVDDETVSVSPVQDSEETPDTAPVEHCVSAKPTKTKKLDVVSDEPALPASAKASTTSKQVQSCKPDVKVESAETTVPEASTTEVVEAVVEGPEAPVAPVVADAPRCEAKRAAPVRVDDRPNEEPIRHKTKTVEKGTVLVGDWTPVAAGFTGWKAPVELPKAEKPKESVEKDVTTALVDQAQPATAAAPVLQASPVVVAPANVIPPPVQAAASDEGQERRERPAPSEPVTPMVDQVAQLDSNDDAVRQTQVANARLAAQLAELVGDRNVTEFKVELSEGRRADGPNGPTTRAPVETQPTPTPRLRDPAAGSKEQVDQAVPALPIKSETPMKVERQTVTSNRLLDLSDAPKIAEPLRVAREAAGPIVPALRKEIPAAPQSEKKTDVPLPEKARPRDDHASESPTAASSANPNRSESLTSKTDSAAPRESREARNLPQENSGNDRPAGSADRVTVQVSDAEGRQTRIRVSVLGDQVRAVIVPPDSESARQLEQRMDDLQTALARQGFASSKVSVQQAGETAVERNGATLAGMASGGESRAAPSGRDQPAGDQRQGRGQREQQDPGDGHRHPNGRSRDQGAQHRRRQTDV